ARGTHRLPARRAGGARRLRGGRRQPARPRLPEPPLGPAVHPRAGRRRRRRRGGAALEAGRRALSLEPAASVDSPAGAPGAASGGRRALVGAGLMLAVAVGLANGLNAVFQIALARILDPDEYSLLAALVAVILVGAVPPLAFQATTARRVARSLAD